MAAALKWAVSVLLLGWLLHRTPVHEVWQSLSSLDPVVLFAAFALTVFAWIASAVRLWFLAPELTLPTVLRMTFVGLYYGTVLPGQVTGDVVKAYKLSPQQRVPGRAAAVVGIDRIVALAVLFAIGAVAAGMLQAPASAFVPLLSAGAAVIVLAAIIATSHGGTALLARWSGSPRFGRLGVLGGRLAVGLQSVRDHPLGLAANVAIAILFHAACVGVHLALGGGLGIALGVTEWTMVYACVSLLLVLPVSIAGVGLREGGYVALLSLFGVAASQALSISFVLLGFTLAGAVIGALADAAPRLR